MRDVNDNDNINSENEPELSEQEGKQADPTIRFRDAQDQRQERREMKRFQKNRQRRGRFDDEF